MEYVIVKFEDDRALIIDGTPQGRTNVILELEEGTHIIKIQSPPANFKPSFRRPTLTGTTVFLPKEVSFEKIQP